MEQNNDLYLRELIAKFQNLKNLKAHQKLILNLEKKQDLNSVEIKQLKAAMTYEKSLELANQKKIKLSNALKSKKLQDKKQRKILLENATNLLVISNLLNLQTGEFLLSKNALIGALLSVSSQKENKEKIQAWEKKGENFLQLANSNQKTKSKTFKLFDLYKEATKN